eukprot:TRINITY_DN58218_c0_g1_i1.p1 TRINITY_DN58218_c0_g1~~TRINITY_DN58218_c0_g1_i1.p1  ORF type:complete len:116 (-),score=25.09 TRINITY_DN58218_c0_g1_i1:72-371(-)
MLRSLVGSEMCIRDRGWISGAACVVIPGGSATAMAMALGEPGKALLQEACHTMMVPVVGICAGAWLIGIASGTVRLAASARRRSWPGHNGLLSLSLIHI